jgi:dipeptidyl aminopeptidase/acylaminoacyl peptidase
MVKNILKTVIIPFSSMRKLTDYKIMPIFPMAPVDDPQISPDGSKVLFTYSEVNMEEDKYDTQIWLLDLKEKSPRQFTFGKENSSNPRWSPDGTQILFTSNRPSRDDPKEENKKKKAQVFVIPADGGEAKQITNVDEGVKEPAWSPDGKTILFSSMVQKGEKVEESDVKIIRRIRYKYDGQGFFQGKRLHLFTIPAKGGKTKQITDGEYDVESATWSPDSKQIAFITNMDDDADLVQYKNIYITTPKGGEPKQIWKGEGPVNALSWSPDGKYVAFTGRVIEDPDLIFYRNIELFVLPLDEGKPKLITGDFDRTLRRVKELKWSPDSKHIYFTYPDKGSTQIGRADIDGTVEPVTEGEISISSFSICMDGSILAFCATDALWPNEVWIKDGKKTRRLTNIQAKTMEIWDVSPPEMFWFKASDGVNVQGWIIKLHGYEEDKKYPLILEIHGGPHSAYGYKLGPAEHEFQLLARNGYVVVYTNPRDSVGYGEEFAGIVEGNWGSRDFQDIMEAVDHVLENYDYVDPERLGVAGGSFGGFMTNWTVTHTKRFKAAVTMRSVASWYSQVALSDVGWGRIGVGSGLDPWDIPEQYLDRSPLTYIKDVETPLLIIHSENDYRCPMPEGEKLFVALKRLKKEVEFIRFYNEPHGLSRTGKPSHRVARLRHIIRWFDKHLK